MFTKILVPVDLTDKHQQALEIAARLANESGGEVTLVHVVEVIGDLWDAGDRDFYDRIEGLEHLDRAIELFDPAQRASGRLRLGASPGIVPCTTSAFVLWSIGRPEQAIERGAQALRLAEELVATGDGEAAELEFSAAEKAFGEMGAMPMVKRCRTARTVEPRARD